MVSEEKSCSDWRQAGCVRECQVTRRWKPHVSTCLITRRVPSVDCSQTITVSRRPVITGPVYSLDLLFSHFHLQCFTGVHSGLRHHEVWTVTVFSQMTLLYSICSITAVLCAVLGQYVRKPENRNTVRVKCLSVITDKKKKIKWTNVWLYKQ